MFNARFLYGAVFRFLVDIVIPAPDNDRGCSKIQLNHLLTKDFDEGVPVTDETMFFLDHIWYWPRYDKLKVHLYNVKEDPYETQNLALENRDLVEAMADRVRELGRPLSLSFLFSFLLSFLSLSFVCLVYSYAHVNIVPISCEFR
jgi:hypothetical protein